MKIYLATKYTDDNPINMELSYERINDVAAKLMLKGHVVFSPITHSHCLAKRLQNQTDRDFWLSQSIRFIDWAQALVVFEPEECRESYGVQREVEFAKQKNLPIYKACWKDYDIAMDYLEEA